MTDASDYPAAHSMDTTWFAVDAEGHVALFDSLEGGAVPREGAWSQDLGSTVSGAILRAVAHRSFEYVSRARAGPYLQDHNEWWENAFRVVVFVAHESAARRLVEAGGRAVRSDRGFAVMVRSPSETLTALHERGECLGCWDLPTWRFDDSRGIRNLARRGVYVYSHQITENEIAGPYSQMARPIRPITIFDVLPMEDVPLFAFPGSFRDTPLLQPLDWWDCASSGGFYLMSDLRHVAPIPGRCVGEGFGFEEEKEMLAAWLPPRFVILRPGEVPAADPDEPR